MREEEIKWESKFCLNFNYAINLSILDKSLSKRNEILKVLILEATAMTVVKYSSEVWALQNGGKFARCFPETLPTGCFGPV